MRATPIRKFDYLFGRFAGAFLAGFFAFSSVPLGILVGSFMPWLDQVKVGPFRPEDYLYAYVLMAGPTLFVMAAAFFALATATRSMMATYVGVVGFLVFYFVLTGLFDRPQFDQTIGLLEPFGLGALSQATKYWTASDRNTMLPPLGGIILENRAIWFSTAFVFLAIAYSVFRFGTRGESVPRRRGRMTRAPNRAPNPFRHRASTLRRRGRNCGNGHA